MRAPKILGLILSLFLLGSCNAEELNPAQIHVQSPEAYLTATELLNLSYGPHPQQKFDIYLPEGRRPDNTPVLVLIHGGGWVDGDKTGLDFMVRQFQGRFPYHAIVNMNYVLAAPPDIPAFPNQFEDVGLLLDHLQVGAEGYGIRPSFGLVGISAGAHLALMYDYAYDADGRVSMVASIVGPTDLSDPFYASNPNFDFYNNLFRGHNISTTMANLSQWSPITHVSTYSSPTLLFYGKSDSLITTQNGKDLNMALSNKRISNSLTIYEGGHFYDWKPADMQNMLEQVENYVYLYLAPDQP